MTSLQELPGELPAERWHGTISGYTYHKCRCDKCRQAKRIYSRGYYREWIAGQVEERATRPPNGEHWHGTANGYNNRCCRCEPCRAAWAEYHAKGGYQARYRARKAAQRAAQGRTEGAS